MQNIDIWHKHDLYRGKIILLLLVVLPSFVFSQRNVMENDLKFSRKPYHFGIHLASGFGDFKIKQNADNATTTFYLSYNEPGLITPRKPFSSKQIFNLA